MNRRTLIWLGLLLVGWHGQAAAQSLERQLLTLEQVVSMAQANSPEAKRAVTTKENRYWNYQAFRANYLPSLSLSGQLPNLNRTITSIPQDDGTQQFVETSTANSSLNLSLSQNVGLTGGQISISSQLQRIDNFGDVSSVSYQSSPALINYTQPLFAFNELRWDRKIEPLLYEESQREYIESMETVAQQATDQFFSLLVAQKNFEIARKNLNNNDTLYQIAQGRYNLGKIAENDLLQMELSVMNARNNLAQAELDIDLANLNLAIFLGLTGEEQLVLLPPESYPNFEVDEAAALSYAQKFRKDVVQFDRQLLEAERSVAQARGQTGLNANLNASFGLTNTASSFGDIYRDPTDQQGLLVGFSIPILDWGASRSQVRTAVANRDLTRLDVQQQRQNFRQEVILLAKQFRMQRTRLLIAAKADTIAQKRYDISKKRYKVGKIDILDLNVALEEKDRAKRDYLGALQTFWSIYYELRRKTLYDFERKQPITY
ncbi:MAG: TolC family protein [Bacteroidota bacterium]